MVVDIGGGTTEIAIISRKVVFMPIHCVLVVICWMNISLTMPAKRMVVIGETTAERIKQEVGMVYPDDKVFGNRSTWS